MKTRAAKLKSKRISRAGRPRKEGERYPSGDIKRSETQKETMSVAIEARARIHDLKDAPAELLKSNLVGYTLGRIYLDGNITKEQLEAGDEYALTMATYYRCVGIPYPSARAQSIFSIKGHDGEVTETMASRARRASNRMMEIMGILLQCVDGPQVRATVHNVTVMDYDHLRGMPPQQLLWLKRGLNALHADKILRTHGKSVKSWDIQSSEVCGAA